jgi:hypothetical protein
MPVELLVPIGIFVLGVIVAVVTSSAGAELLEQNKGK